MVSVRNHITPQPDIIGACAHLAKHDLHAPFVNFDSLCTVMGLHQSMELADTQVLKLLEYFENILLLIGSSIDLPPFKLLRRWR